MYIPINRQLWKRSFLNPINKTEWSTVNKIWRTTLTLRWPSYAVPMPLWVSIPSLPLVWSGATGHTEGALSAQVTWQEKLQTVRRNGEHRHWALLTITEHSANMASLHWRTFNKPERFTQWRGFILITSVVWSTSRFSTRAITFHALHVTLGKYHQEIWGELSLLCWWYSLICGLVKHTKLRNLWNA